MDVENKLEQIFKYIGVDFNQNSDLKSCNLLGGKIGMKARDLLIVFFLVEKTFQIQIPEEVIVGEEFNTYCHILEIIRKCQSIE